jgi:hypothetical protein
MTYLYFKTLMTLARSEKVKFPSGGLICRLEDDLRDKVGENALCNLIETWLDIEIPR